MIKSLCDSVSPVAPHHRVQATSSALTQNLTLEPHKSENIGLLVATPSYFIHTTADFWSKNLLDVRVLSVDTGQRVDSTATPRCSIKRRQEGIRQGGRNNLTDKQNGSCNGRMIRPHSLCLRALLLSALATTHGVCCEKQRKRSLRMGSSTCCGCCVAFDDPLGASWEAPLIGS